MLREGALGINEETSRRENTNLLQQSILQQDYQELILLATEGRARHQAHDVKVWRGVLKTEPAAAAGSGGGGEETAPSMPSGQQGLVVGVVGAVVVVLLAVYFSQ